MKKLYAILILVCILALSGCGHEHTWEDANCITPKTCSECSETEGEALGHTWKDATCTAPKTCSVCNETDGEALEHTWNEATCSTPKTCSVCNETVGEALEHNYGEWEIELEATVSTDGVKVRYCENCSEKESKKYQLSSFVKNDKFIFTPEEFRKLFFDNFVELGYSRFGGAQIQEKDGQVMVAIRDSSYNNVGNIGFVVDGNTWQMASTKTESGFDGILMIISAEEEFVANAILCMVMSCDPTTTEAAAREIAKSILEEETEWGGINFTFAITGNYYTMTAVVAK